MRLVLVLLWVLMARAGYAQADTLLPATHWMETSPGERLEYRLVLSREGNFEEDAGENHERPYRYLLGKWKVNAEASKLTLSVDGALGKTGVHPRYLRGRDYYLDYEIIHLSADSLVLRDLMTAERRTFSATTATDYVAPEMRRIPKPANDGLFKLPKRGRWGGA